MAELKKDSLAANLAGYTINDISRFREAVRGLVGIRIGGVFTYGNKYRLANMINNPMATRYGILGSSAGGDFVGERYGVESKLLPKKGFLDTVGGLEGYTHEGGYLNYVQNTYVQRNMSESIEKNLMELRKKQERYDEYEQDKYTVDDEPQVNKSVNESLIIDDLNRLGKFYTDVFENNDTNVFPNITTQSGIPSKLFAAKDAIARNAKEYLGNTFESFGESEHILEGKYVNNEVQPISEGNGDSIKNKFVASRTEIVMPKPNNGKTLFDKTYSLYNEDNDLVKGVGENTIIGHNIDEIIFDETPDSVDKQTLLYKTNELFKSGKINSLINRFHTSSNDYSDNEVSETQSAVDDTYGLSRGRNLLKNRFSTHHDGYENPYCRVWTTHYQYSKFNDLIRHKGYDENDGMFGFGVLRPNNSMKRLNKFSSLQENGLVRVAPKSPEEVKKCMFSIENLAWKDIEPNSFVDGTGEKYGRTLSKEQQGPNGGRIMWFPPYNLKVNENVNVNWNSNNFIGRGEPIYTYTNTERTGTLSFTVLVDHPSIVDNFVNSKEGQTVNYENEQRLLRFFAGCDDGTVEDTIVIKQDIPQNFAINTDEIPKTTPKPEDEQWDVKLRYFVFFPNNFSGKDFYKDGDVMTPVNYLWKGAYSGGTGYEVNTNPNLGINGCVSSSTIKGGQMNGGGQAYWHYQVDMDKATEALLPGNYKDTTSFGLNTSNGFKTQIESSKVRNTLHILDDEVNSTFSYQDLLNTDFSILQTFFDDKKGTIQDSEFQVKCYVRGYASSHGYVRKNLGEDGLAKRRARFLKKYLESLNFTDSDNILITDNGVIEVPKDNRDVSSLDAKLGRCAEVIIGLVRKNNKPNVQPTEDGTNISEENREQVKTVITRQRNVFSETGVTTTEGIAHYDDEYLYFKKINDSSDLVRRNLIEKVQYFDPAFHSITPEGFNARLTFLHQCTRQGPTTSASDLNGQSAMGAGNLAFGRPPVCILRIGDFYFTKIIIDSLSIDYDSSGGIQWDLNPEGVGIQPMLANITLGIKFLGGSDLSGPIARLQDAVSFNFFANTSVYDRRADYRNDYATNEDDEAMTWRPHIVNDNDTKPSLTTHKPFSTIKK